MGTTHKSKTATAWNENTFAAGTVWDNDENEYFVVAYAQVEFEAPNTRGLPEDYDEGFSSVTVTRVNVITGGGGQYAKSFESFPIETQKQIVALIECDGQPTYTIDSGN